MSRENFTSGTEWEDIVGYSRVVKVGNVVHVAGTTATDENGNIVGVGDPYAQAVQALKNIERALEMAGATMANVVRTRMYVTDIEMHWEAIGQAHSEVFGKIRPVTTMVEIARLINHQMLVEIEVEAII